MWWLKRVVVFWYAEVIIFTFYSLSFLSRSLLVRDVKLFGYYLLIQYVIPVANFYQSNVHFRNKRNISADMESA